MFLYKQVTLSNNFYLHGESDNTDVPKPKDIQVVIDVHLSPFFVTVEKNN